MKQHTRRAFLGQIAGACAGSTVLRGAPLDSRALARDRQGKPPRWADRLGLQLYTVRDRLGKDFEGTLALVAEAGYKEIELFGSLGKLAPKDIRQMLDLLGLTAVSTHIALTPGPDLERQLGGYRTIGHRYTAVNAGADAAASQGVDRWKREADALNQVGRAGKPYGIQALFHNHVAEFVPIGGAGTPYEILLAETDPEFVVMELDVGWASIAGQDVVAMFNKNPGRYALWHVKDSTGLAAAHARPIEERQKAAQFVPVGAGEVDYKSIFAAAQTAGLQHYFVEQDNAIDRDSIAAIRTSAQNLKRLLGGTP